jgi:hypothetical protein
MKKKKKKCLDIGVVVDVTEPCCVLWKSGGQWWLRTGVIERRFWIIRKREIEVGVGRAYSAIIQIRILEQRGVRTAGSDERDVVHSTKNPVPFETSGTIWKRAATAVAAQTITDSEE